MIFKHHSDQQSSSKVCLQNKFTIQSKFSFSHEMKLESQVNLMSITSQAGFYSFFCFVPPKKRRKIVENKIYENIMIDVNAVITLSEKRCEKNMQSCQNLTC